MDDTVVVDTHALLWFFDHSGALSTLARDAIEAAARIDVSAITFWEIEMLRRKGRVALDRSTERWRFDLLQTGRFAEIPLTGQLGIRAAALEQFHGDPADRMIVAAALAESTPLVTKDEQIRDWAAEHGLDVVW